MAQITLNLKRNSKKATVKYIDGTLEFSESSDSDIKKEAEDYFTTERNFDIENSDIVDSADNKKVKPTIDRSFFIHAANELFANTGISIDSFIL